MKAAIAGAGLMGAWHARAAQHAGAAVVLVIDPDESRGKALARRFAGARWSADADSIANAGVEAAHVCTPLSDHEASVGRAIAAGVSCLVEKPLGPDSASTQRLLELARARGVIVCPSHQYLYQRGVMKAVAAAGSIGPLRQCLALCCTAGAERGFDPASLAADILPHHLAIFRRLSGDRFTPLLWRASSVRPGELSAWAADEDTAYSIVVSTAGRPTRNEVELIGDGGTLRIDLFHGFAVQSGSRVSRASKAARPLVSAAATFASATYNLARRAVDRETAFPGLRELVCRFYDSVRTRSQSPIGSGETLDVAIARDAIIGALRD